MTIRQISFMSYAMRGTYTLEPRSYGTHNRGVLFVDLVEATLDK